MSSITASVLQNWKNAEISLFVHIYSTSISSQQLFKRLKKELIDPANVDRAGASSILEVNRLVELLKETHKYNYTGADIHWVMWANQIHGSDAHRRDAMVNEPPPGRLIELFSAVREHPDAVLQRSRHNISVGATVAESLGVGIRDCLVTLDRFQNLIEQVSLVGAELKQKLTLLDSNTATSQRILDAVNDSLHVTESGFSEEVFGRITNQDDIDHGP